MLKFCTINAKDNEIDRDLEFLEGTEDLEVVDETMAFNFIAARIMTNIVTILNF